MRDRGKCVHDDGMSAVVPEAGCRYCRERDEIIEGLRARVAELEMREGEREAEHEAREAEHVKAQEEAQRAYEKLQRQVDELREQLGLNSGNSSKPPSSDGTKKRSGSRSLKPRKKKGRKGRKGSARELVPAEEVTEFVECVPSSCRCCGGVLHGTDAEPQRHQVTELPERIVEITEYRLHSLSCEHCGESTRGELPNDAHPSAFGPRMVAFMATLTGVFRLSKSKAAQLLDLLGAPVSTGGISNQEAAVSAALEQPYEEVRESIQRADLVHMDETHWKLKTRKLWLWVACTAAATLFVVRKSRGKAVSQDILGDEFTGYIVTDRYNAYHWVDDTQRQFCWAHLGRDFQRVSERPGEAGQIGQALVWAYALLFHMKHRLDEGSITRKTFERHVIRTIRPDTHKLLIEAMTCGHPKTEGFATELYKRRKCLFTFLKDPNIPLTNNTAERAIRHPVIWRKTSFGTQSNRGNRFVERILTVWATLHRCPRKVLDFLSLAVTQARRGKPPPTLLLPA